jgi:hypothetical protein
VSAVDTANATTLPDIPSFSRRLAEGAIEMIWALGIVLLLPAVIIALGLPLVLCVRLAMWIVGMQ